jgi:uncharacterized membrane-anchored protein YhcB (DUF1043 family)
MSDIITGAVVAVISLIIGFFGKVGYDLWHDNYVEKKQKRKEALNNHFFRLNENVITPLMNKLQSLRNDRGEISQDGKGRHWGTDDENISLDLKDWSSFSLHFENTAEMVQGIIEEINIHNKQFDYYISQLIEKLNKIRPLHSNFITPSIFSSELLRLSMEVLFEMAGNRFENTSYPIIRDFREADVVQEGERWVLKSKFGTIYATSNAEANCEHYKKMLINIQNSQDLQKMTYDLENSAARLVTKCSNTCSVLDFIRHSYEKLGKTLERVDECYYCQTIFGGRKEKKLNDL